ncbi:unnamed protein product [Closterium sp. Naga37s-1]|nr:unnamed protein product [Closterium sp. Naga37s-1]
MAALLVTRSMLGMVSDGRGVRGRGGERGKARWKIREVRRGNEQEGAAIASMAAPRRLSRGPCWACSSRLPPSGGVHVVGTLGGNGWRELAMESTQTSSLPSPYSPHLPPSGGVHAVGTLGGVYAVGTRGSNGGSGGHGFSPGRHAGAVRLGVMGGLGGWWTMWDTSSGQAAGTFSALPFYPCNASTRAPAAAGSARSRVFWTLSYLAEPLSLAAQSLVGRDIKSRPQRASRTARQLLLMAAVTGAVLALLVLTLSLCASHLLSSDPGVRRAVRSVAWHSAACECLCAVSMSLEGIAIGAGAARVVEWEGRVRLGGGKQCGLGGCKQKRGHECLAAVSMSLEGIAIGAGPGARNLTRNTRAFLLPCCYDINRLIQGPIIRPIQDSDFLLSSCCREEIQAEEVARLLDPRRLTLLIAGMVTLVASNLCVNLIGRHTREWTKPREQRAVMVLVGLAPVVALDSYFGLAEMPGYEWQVALLHLLKDCYVAYGMSEFLALLSALLKVPPRPSAPLPHTSSHRRMLQHSFPFSLFLRPEPSHGSSLSPTMDHSISLLTPSSSSTIPLSTHFCRSVP